MNRIGLTASLLLLLTILAGCDDPRQGREFIDPTEDVAGSADSSTSGDAGTPSDLALPTPDGSDSSPRPDQEVDSGLVSLPDTGPEVPGAFSLASYNVHDLFDTTDDPEEDEVLTEDQLELKLGRLARVIATFDVDIIGLQEIEHRALLDRLFDHPALAGRGYVHRFHIEAEHPRGIEVAAVSRIPIERVVNHPENWRADGRTSYFNPPVLEVRFLVGDRRVILFVVHLPSKVGGAAMDEVRWALATHLRWLVDSALRTFPRALVAVVGDFNDLPDSITLANARGSGAGALVDLTALAPAAERYSYVYESQRQLIDYILAEPALAQRVVRGSTRFSHTRDSQVASDHSPLWTRFSW